MSGPAILLGSILAPGVFCWWSGRQLLRRRDDAALAERMLVRRQHLQLVIVLSCVPLPFIAAEYYWFAVAGLLAGSWIGDYPSRRVLLDERWTLATYLGWQARFCAAYFGVWFALLLAPTVIHAAGAWRWPVAGALALSLGLWAHRYAPTFFWLMRARPMAPPADWQAILERSHARRPRLLSMPVPGGRFVNALAFPSARVPSVLFTAPALELLTVREQAAVFAHELGHLEHYDRRRCRIAAAATYGLVALGTLGAALVMEWLAGGIFLTVWSFALVVGFALRTSRQKAHETESDQRALALCRDADALISGLTKLTLAGRLPRRWSSELEHHASHPSLARRVHAIRRTAGIAPASPPSAEALVVSTMRSGAHLILDEHGVSWLNGVPDPAPREPAALRQAAASSWSVPYSELVELRVAASWWGGASLVARDRTGASRAVTIAPADVQALQRRLDAIEDRLPHDAVLADPPAVVGRLTALALWLASAGTLLPLGVIVGLIAIIRPSRAALAAVAGTAGACILVFFGDLADGSQDWTTAASAGAAACVAVVAAWLAARRRTFDWRKADYLPALVAGAVVLAMTWGPLLVGTHRSWTMVVQLLAGAPVSWAALGALGCALVTAPRRGLRACGLAVLAVAVVANLGVRVIDAVALSRGVAPPPAESVPLPRVARLELPARAGSLRVSPLGTRVAVATGNSARATAARFLVLGIAGGRAEVEARDLRFVDESHALVVTESADATTLQQVEVSGGPGVARGWRAVVTGVEHLRLSSVEDAAWAALGYDAETEDFIGLVGRIGTGEIKRQALGDEDGGAVVALSPSGRGLRTLSELTPLAGLPWARLLYTRSLPRESRVWRLDDGREHFVAALPAHARCHLVGRGLASVVCIGSDRGRTLVWRFDLATGPTAPLIIPGIARRFGVSLDGRLVALWTPDEMLMVDLDLARAGRWAVSPAAGFPTQIVPVPGRLVVLSHSATGPAIDVYDVHW